MSKKSGEIQVDFLLIVVLRQILKNQLCLISTEQSEYNITKKIIRKLENELVWTDIIEYKKLNS